MLLHGLLPVVALASHSLSFSGRSVSLLILVLHVIWVANASPDEIFLFHLALFLLLLQFDLTSVLLHSGLISELVEFISLIRRRPLLLHGGIISFEPISIAIQTEWFHFAISIFDSCILNLRSKSGHKIVFF